MLCFQLHGNFTAMTTLRNKVPPFQILWFLVTLWSCILDTIVTAYRIVNLTVCLYKRKALWGSPHFMSYVGCPALILMFCPLPFITPILRFCPYALCTYAHIPLRNKVTCRKKLSSQSVFLLRPYSQACCRSPILNPERGVRLVLSSSLIN